MRILQLISSGGFYGAESVLLNLANELKRSEHECVLGVFENTQNPNTEVARRAQESGLRTALIPCRGQVDRQAVQAIRSLVQDEKVDLVHTHGYKADMYGYLATRRLGLPLVATCHSWVGQSLSMRLYARLDRVALRHFDCVAAVSEKVAGQLLAGGLKPSRVAKIPNGIPVRDAPSQVRGLRQDTWGTDPVVGTVGRISREKGLDVLLQAATRICNKHRRVHFVLVGDGPDRPVLERIARQSGLEGNVVFTGAKRDMSGVYESFDVFVQPSLQEGMPMALLEAMAVGVAVVASRVGDIPSVIVNETTGLLVPPGDPGELERALRVLLSDPERRRRMGENARNLVRESFSASRMTQQYLRLYDQVLRQRFPDALEAMNVDRNQATSSSARHA
jgi:glycosyltransferase involved in cell wall biosynthesis